MKFLEDFSLLTLTQSLSEVILGGRLINGRVESYSTKKAGSDKKESKVLEQKFGKDGDNSTKSLLIDLIQTLNASLSDYDFSSLITRPDSFSMVPVHEVIGEVNQLLAEMTTQNPRFLTEMWRIIDSAISVSKCDVYQLTDDSIVDTDGEIVWSFHYFFCNKESKRILFFTCIATNKFRRHEIYGHSGDSDDEDDAMDEVHSNVTGELERADTSDEEMDDLPSQEW